MSKLTPFHLAIPVDNIPVCRKFYKEILGCEEGRSSDHWVDFNLFGHQLVIHFKEKSKEKTYTNPVDGKEVPIPHFGVVLEWDIFHEFSKKLTAKGR
jgi:extradiol dioxygenase family protein